MEQLIRLYSVVVGNIKDDIGVIVTQALRNLFMTYGNVYYDWINRKRKWIK